jgi:hypothetical protein
MTEIESIDSGSMVGTIEDLIGDIQTFRDASVNIQNATAAGLVKADDVEWTRSGKGAGIIAQYNALRQQLSQLIGIPITGSNGARLIRTDRYSLTGRPGYLTDYWDLAW